MYRTCDKCGSTVQEHTSHWEDGRCPNCGASVTAPAKNSASETVFLVILATAALVFVLGTLFNCSRAGRYEDEIPYEDYMDSYVIPPG